MKSKLKGRLWVRGVDPAVVTATLCLRPGIEWRRGDPNPEGPQLSRREDAWAIESRVADSASLEAHVRDMLDQVSGLQPRLEELARGGASVSVWVSVWSIGGDRPDLSLGAATVRELALIEADFAVDLYVVP